MNKNIFTLRKPEKNEDEIKDESIDSTISLSEWGWNKAENMKGSVTCLKVCLKQILQDYKRKVRNDRAEQEKAKRPYLVKLQERKGDHEIYNDRLNKINEEEIPELADNIAKLQDEIIYIRKNPEDITGVKRSNIGLYIGSVI